MKALVSRQKVKKTKGVVLDANVLVAYLYRKDPNHKQALEVVRRAGKKYLPAVAVMEAAYSMQKKGFSLYVLKEAIVGKIAIVENDASDFEDALLSEDLPGMKYDDFADRVILHCVKRKGLRLCTFDNDMKERAEGYVAEGCN